MKKRTADRTQNPGRGARRGYPGALGFERYRARAAGSIRPGANPMSVKYRDRRGRRHQTGDHRQPRIFLSLEGCTKRGGAALGGRPRRTGGPGRRATGSTAGAKPWRKPPPVFVGEFSDGRIRRGRMTERDPAGIPQAASRVRPCLRWARARSADIARRDIEHLVETMPGPTHNRVFGALLAALSVVRGLGTPPAIQQPGSRYRAGSRNAPVTESSRADEMSRLAAALADREEANSAAVAAIRVAAMTGLRISEVLAMEWEHFDPETGRIVLPATKTGRRTHDLPDAALRILASLPAPSRQPFCFTNGRNAGVAYRHCAAVFRAVAVAAGLQDCRLHDLRRSLATRAAASGVSLLELRDMLGWKDTAMPARYVQLSGQIARENRRKVGNAVADLML